LARRSTALVRDEEELELEGGRLASDKICTLGRATPRPCDFAQVSESTKLPFSEEESSDESKSAFPFPGCVPINSRSKAAPRPFELVEN